MAIQTTNTGPSTRLKVVQHSEEPHAANSYMIANSMGAVIGGNLQQFILFKDCNRNCYPTRFKSRTQGEYWLTSNASYVEFVETFCKKKVKKQKQKLL